MRYWFRGVWWERWRHAECWRAKIRGWGHRRIGPSGLTWRYPIATPDVTHAAPDQAYKENMMSTNDKMRDAIARGEANILDVIRFQEERNMAAACLKTQPITITIVREHGSPEITVTDDGGEFEDDSFYDDGTSTATVRRTAQSEAEDRAAHYEQCYASVRVVVAL